MQGLLGDLTRLSRPLGGDNPTLRLLLLRGGHPPQPWDMVLLRGGHPPRGCKQLLLLRGGGHLLIAFYRGTP